MPILKIVDNVAALRARMKIGLPMRMVVFTEQGSVAVKGTIRSRLPFTLVASCSEQGLIQEGNRVLLILCFKREYFKAEALISKVTRDGKEWSFEISDELWEQVDRRRYPRHGVVAPVQIRAIQEDQGNAFVKRIEGYTEDLSVGGAWVKLAEKMEVGSLVEFQSSLSPQENVRMLGLVANSTEEGCGIEFLDYVGSSRYILHTYLTQQAA